MKLNFSIKRILTAFVAILALSSCDDYLDVNTSPNNPTDVPANLVFVTGQVVGAYEMYGPLNLVGSLWSQQWASTGGQYRQQDQYRVATNTFNNQWNQLYEDCLIDLQFTIDKSTELGIPNYVVPARILRAYFFQLMTEYWGDIPYSEALQGSAFLTPQYDSQESIYDQLLAELDLAISEIDRSDDAITYSGLEDPMYGGDMDAWERFANTMKLRIYIRMTNANPAKAEQGIRGILSSGAPLISSVDEDGEVPFFDEANNRNPQWEQNDTRPNDFGPSTQFLIRLNALQDPRANFYFDEPGNTPDTLVGAVNGLNANDLLADVDDYSRLSEFFRSETKPSVLLSYHEVLFMQAEAAARGWSAGNAEQLYNDAVTAAFNKYGLEIGTYLDPGMPAAFPRGGSAEDQLNAIYLQKYIALFSQGAEAFTEWRRTQVPTLLPALNDGNGNVFITRFPYVDDEVSKNPNVPAISTTEKLWFAK